MTRKSAHRWRPITDSKPSLSKYIKVFFSLISISQSQILPESNKNSVVVKNQCNDECNYTFTSNMFSDGANNYLSRSTDGYESCGDTAKSLYDRNTETITQIQQGQLCLGEPASYPYPTKWELIWQLDIPQCPGADCYALGLYSPKNTTLDMAFVNCVETAFSQNQDQYNNDVADCQKRKFNYGWLAFPAVVFLSVIGYVCKKYCFNNEEEDDDDDDVQNFYKYHSRHSEHSQQDFIPAPRSERSLQTIGRFSDEEEECIDNETSTVSAYEN